MSFDAFVGGFLNPLTVPAHLVVLLGLGLLVGGRRGGGAVVPLSAFVLGLAAGLAAIARGAGQTPAIDILLAATVVSGLLVSLAIALPDALCAGLALVTGVALGLDSPPQAISLASATTALVGTGLSACLALALVAAGARACTVDWQRIGLRILGSWIAASAILVLALRFARGMLLDM
jgi:urease accessory protein